MKVRVTLTVEVDNTTWAEQYGVGETDREVGQDVREYVLHAVHESPAPFQSARLVK